MQTENMAINQTHLSQKHILIIGGTGMLKQTTWHFAETNTISLIARNPFDVAAKHSNIKPIKLDYQDSNALRTALKDTIKKYGAIDIAILWIHNTAPEAPLIVSEVLNTNTCIVHHLQGSASYRPDKIITPQIKALRAPNNIDYRTITLGFVKEAHYARWLTNQEIAEGTIYAVENNLKTHIIGQIEPWSDKP